MLPRPFFRDVDVLFVQFDADELATMLQASEPCRTSARERIEHGIAGFGSGKNATLGKPDRESGEVGFRCGLWIDVPPGAEITGFYHILHGTREGFVLLSLESCLCRFWIHTGSTHMIETLGNRLISRSAICPFMVY